MWCQAPGPECLQLRKQRAALGPKGHSAKWGRKVGGSLKENSGQEATKVAESLGR